MLYFIKAYAQVYPYLILTVFYSGFKYYAQQSSRSSPASSAASAAAITAALSPRGSGPRAPHIKQWHYILWAAHQLSVNCFVLLPAAAAARGEYGGLRLH